MVTPPYSDPVRDAGASAFAEAAKQAVELEQLRLTLDFLSDSLRQRVRTQGNWSIGAEGERAVVRTLMDLTSSGWHMLPDRRWPRTRSANIDLLLVGPGGVFVADVKSWSDGTFSEGRLWHGDVDAQEHVDKVLRQAEAVEDVLVSVGVPSSELAALLILARDRGREAMLGRVHVLTQDALLRYLLRRGARLAPETVDAVAAALDKACPRMPQVTPPPRPRTAHVSPVNQPPLISTEEINRTLWNLAVEGPMESWMTWLHPSQARIASRRLSGPARIRGTAGTGKSVVALLRARHLAAHGRRVLFTSYLRNLAPINRSLLTRMAPDDAQHVEFATVHAVALGYVHGSIPPYHQDVADTCFARAWAHVRRSSPLTELGVPWEYWKAEIARVIKGRSVKTFQQYATLQRVGRRTPLQPRHREAVWELYERYQHLLRQQGICDADDVVLAARDVLQEAPKEDYDAVIVDEVQDLTCVALQMLHALVGDRPDGLLLVGDGQQSIYPGGCSLAEAGISVVGRSSILQRNYRNRAEILRYALSLIDDDDFDDLDGVSQHGRRVIEIEHDGGEVVIDRSGEEEALVRHLQRLHVERGVRYGDMAVLVPHQSGVSRSCSQLREHGLPFVHLTTYDGAPCEAVKVGTVHRAKGLDFAHVSVPDTDQLSAARRPGESDDAYQERRLLERRQLYVALTRARDSVWLAGLDPVNDDADA